MKSLALKINAMSFFDIKSNIIIKSMLDIIHGDEYSAFTAYGNICHELALSGSDLSSYLHDLILTGETNLLKTLSENNSTELNKFFDYDYYVIKEISKLDGSKLKDYLTKRFNDETDTIRILPEFINSKFYYDKSYFMEKIQSDNTSIFTKYKAFIYNKNTLKPVLTPDTVKLSDLKEYNAQKQLITENTEVFLNGKKAQNVLLYGDRGTGKSSTVKALVNHFDELKIISVEKSEILYLPELFEIIRKTPYKFIIFFDDLTFEANESSYNTLKQILEGSVVVKPDNILIYATTNRRHLIKETVADRDRDVFHRGDSLDDNVSLSDRFGLYVTFSLPDKLLYIKIVSVLAEENNLNIPCETLEKKAEAFALKKGGRSPRIARQFVEIISSEI